MVHPLHALAAIEAHRFDALRRVPRHSDEALTGTARGWLRRLPATCRPLRLCLRYPRLANHLAWCWPDPALAAQAIDELLGDGRGNRGGFPRGIVAELRQLRDFNARGRQAPPLGFWGRLQRAWLAL